jgi:hypothetical protein
MSGSSKHSGRESSQTGVHGMLRVHATAAAGMVGGQLEIPLPWYCAVYSFRVPNATTEEEVHSTTES